MGTQLTTRTDKKHAVRPLPAEAADVALIAADTCAAIGDVSVSWWHEEVRTDRAPKPVIQQPRFTRWRLADVRRFWAERAAQSATNSEASERMAARAKKASVKAREPAAVAKALATRKTRAAARAGAAT
jgi:predicted DNA-binding transcriptional regulator AlpA